MANENKPDAKLLAAGAERVVPHPRELTAKFNSEKIEERHGPGRFRLVAVLIAGLALAAPGCALDSSGLSQDAGAEQDENPDANVEMDADSEVEQDADADSDVAEAEDSPDVPEVEADVDVVEDEASDVSEDGGTEDAMEAEDGGVEDAGCITTPVYDITGTALDENVGESRQMEEFWYRTDSYSGPECEAEAGERVFEKIMFRLETPIADTSPEGLREVVRRGGITKGFGSLLNKKILGIASDHITLATIIDGGVMGPGMPVGQLFDGEKYLVWLDGTGTNPDGTKYASFSFFDTVSMMPAGGARVNEGEYYVLPNGNRVMATGVATGAAYSARADMLGPADDRITNGTIRMREEDGMPYRFGMEVPDGWSLYPTTL